MITPLLIGDTVTKGLKKILETIACKHFHRFTTKDTLETSNTIERYCSLKLEDCGVGINAGSGYVPGRKGL
jgi:hypothetical protein